MARHDEGITRFSQLCEKRLKMKRSHNNLRKHDLGNTFVYKPQKIHTLYEFPASQQEMELILFHTLLVHRYTERDDALELQTCGLLTKNECCF
jgi:hypothetical protein